MPLSELIDTLPVKILPGQKWSIMGPEARLFEARLVSSETQLLPFSAEIAPQLDGLLLIGALSTTPNPYTWLTEMVQPISSGSVVVVVDWQDDGPPNPGPSFELRFKKGLLSRLLREAGFGVVETVESHPVYYVVQGTKGRAPVLPHAGQYVVVANIAELPKNGMKAVTLFGHKIVVANTGKEIVAFTRTCPHAGGAFDRGLLRGRNVACPLHGYIWNVSSGEPIEPHDEDILPRYAVKIEPNTGQISVALAPPIT